MTTFFLPRKSESFTFLSLSRLLFSSKSGAISPTSGMKSKSSFEEKINCIKSAPKRNSLAAVVQARWSAGILARISAKRERLLFHALDLNGSNLRETFALRAQAGRDARAPFDAAV